MLLQTVPGAYVTQRFGPSALRVEPAMYSTGDKAYWLPYFGASFFEDFHPGIDRSAATGTPIQAMERGTVTFAGWKDSISGYQVEVEIRDGTRYSVNHLSVVSVRVGRNVAKGDMLGRVGSTGATTGPHTHEGLSIREKDSQGIYRTFLYNPALFQSGGKFADDPRIRPEVEVRHFNVNGAGINIRYTPPDLDSVTNVFAISRQDGIYRRGTGKRLSGLGYDFTFLRWREAEGGTWAIGSGYGRRLAVHRSLMHFV